jgi:aspartate carbamoyltransferase regulatory subunit
MTTYDKLQKLLELSDEIKVEIGLRITKSNDIKEKKSVLNVEYFILSDKDVLKQTILWLPNYVTINRITEILKKIDE